MEAPPYEQVVRHDTLPPYQTSVSVTGRLLCKQELLSPDTPALSRHWSRIEAELRGTTLLLFEASGTDSAAKYIRSYTVQAADVGLATDYKHRPNVFRARLEGEQLLFIAPEIDAAVAWVESLLTAIVISDPLENRKMPKYPSLPSRRTNPLGGDVAEGFGRRLWAELAWHARQQREWLLEMPSRTRKERWREVLHGREDGNLRRHSITSGTTSTPQSHSDRRRSSTSSRCQCPCSSCRGTAAPSSSNDEIHQVEEQEGVEERETLSKDTEIDCMALVLEPPVRCTRTLTKFGEWKGDYYIKSGRKVKISPPPTWTPSETSIW